jgi:DeoR/GlpR family transcriptional regulator of sugar metabolism
MTALQALADVESVHVECLGGTLRPLSQGFVGPLTEAALERMTFDRVFLGTDGINTDGDICEADLRQTRLKELMARRAEKVYVLAHAAKLGNRPFHAWAKLPLPWTLVTDADADPVVTDQLLAKGIEVVVATG